MTTFSLVNRIVSLMSLYKFTQKLFPCLLFFGGLTLLSCGDTKSSGNHTFFTRTDSLTETYLTLEDSLIEAWNLIINDDNAKLEAMHNLIHELMVSGAVDLSLLKSFEHRLNSITSSRFTNKTMSNEDVIEEYDFACNALITEIISLAEAQKQFAYNSTLQKLVDKIRVTDQRVMDYREAYDKLAIRYNQFISENPDVIHELHGDTSVSERPIFNMQAEIELE